MRRLIAGCCAAVFAAACSRLPDTATPIAAEAPAVPVIQLQSPPTPYAEVSWGRVHAIVPKEWSAAAIEGTGVLSRGVVASPDVRRWNLMDGSVPGLEAAWVDLARGGIPTDYYYLAARGTAIPPVATAQTCQSHAPRVIVNHRPAFDGDINSLGDYAVRGTGQCDAPDRGPTRYSYFVAAPGYGPVREVGIPTSGLYVVVAVVRQSPYAGERLHTMLMSARFDRTSVAGLLKAAQRSNQLR
jgi:hypothetical protein